MLRDLAQRTQCKVLVTSRRDEHSWLGNLPARVQLPAMPMRESLQLAAALAARHGHTLTGADWRPLLRYTAGNPLTITVVVGQALRADLSTTEQIEAFVARLRAGEAELEAGEDAVLGRTRSLTASLSYGFAQAFTESERARLAVLHLFRETVEANILRAMGDQEELDEDAVPELAGLDREAATGLLDRAVGIGLLEPLHTELGFYRIHPALPWYFTTLFSASHGPPGSPPAVRATRAYVRTMGKLGYECHQMTGEGMLALTVPVLGEEEANLRHALSLARTSRLWHAAAGCLQGLWVLYTRRGRDGEWARLVAAVTPDFTDPATGRPLPGRDDQWWIITEHRVRLAQQARDWTTATTLQNALLAWDRDQAAEALAAPAANLAPAQRHEIRTLAVRLEELGGILLDQVDAGCLPYFQEALSLYERIGGRYEEGVLAVSLGTAYLRVPGLRDLGQAEYWYQRSLRLCADNDYMGQVASLAQLGAVALARFEDAQVASAAESVLLDHLNAALSYYQQALDLTPSGDHETRATVEMELGTIYGWGGYTDQALRHYQQSIQHREARGDIFGAGQTRQNTALVLARAGRVSDALHYARAALGNFQQTGPGATDYVGVAQRLIASLEQGSY